MLRAALNRSVSLRGKFAEICDGRWPRCAQLFTHLRDEFKAGLLTAYCQDELQIVSVTSGDEAGAVSLTGRVIVAA